MKKIMLLVLIALTGCYDKPVKTISRSDFGDKWPLTVESGTLRCEQSGKVIFRTPEKDYALNDSNPPTLPSILEITKTERGTQGEIKVSTDAILKEGRKLCSLKLPNSN